MPLFFWFDLFFKKRLGQKSSLKFVGVLVETMTPKGHFEINWPLQPRHRPSQPASQPAVATQWAKFYFRLYVWFYEIFARKMISFQTMKGLETVESLLDSWTFNLSSISNWAVNIGFGALSSGPPRQIWTRQGTIFYPKIFWLVVSYKCKTKI